MTTPQFLFSALKVMYVGYEGIPAGDSAACVSHRKCSDRGRLVPELKTFYQFLTALTTVKTTYPESFGSF
jgi:hypothetical protein